MQHSAKSGQRLALAVAMIFFVGDIATKSVIVRTFGLHETVQLTPFLNLGYWLNPGAAFSFLSSAGGWQRYFFSAIAIVAILWLVFAILFSASLDKATRIAFGMIAGGAAGNLYDRVVHGAVVDWIDLHWVGWHWPAFNLADCGIVLGAALAVLGSVLTRSASTNG